MSAASRPNEGGFALGVCFDRGLTLLNVGTQLPLDSNPVPWRQACVISQPNRVCVCGVCVCANA
eukprot:13594734-Alexandrium_andersonii.AAC.1